MGALEDALIEANVGWSYDGRASCYVPYTSLGNATRMFLASPQTMPVPVTMVDVSRDERDYHQYLATAWSHGGTFINFEHDIVPWPGAIQSLLDCPHPWCFFGYQDQLKDTVAEAGCAMFGLVRFRRQIIEGLLGAWSCPPLHWRQCDIHFYDYATKNGWRPHQHLPSVFNANLRILNEHQAPYLPQHEWRTLSVEPVRVGLAFGDVGVV